MSAGQDARYDCLNRSLCGNQGEVLTAMGLLCRECAEKHDMVA